MSEAIILGRKKLRGVTPNSENLKRGTNLVKHLLPKLCSFLVISTLSGFGLDVNLGTFVYGRVELQQ